MIGKYNFFLFKMKEAPFPGPPIGVTENQQTITFCILRQCSY
jgi:hypothetical protein